MLRIIAIAIQLAASLGPSQAMIAVNGTSLNGVSFDSAQPKTAAVGSAALVAAILERWSHMCSQALTSLNGISLNRRAAALSGHPRTKEPHMLRIIAIAILLAASLGPSQAYVSFNGTNLNGVSLTNVQPNTDVVGSAALVAVELPR